MAEEIRIEEFEVQLVRKSIKHLYLSVKPPDGRLVVSAPKEMTEADIRHFVLAKRGWILRQQAKLAASTAATPLDYLTGEQHPLWGKDHPLEVHEGPAPTAQLTADGRLLVTLPSPHTKEQREQLVEQLYRQKLALALPPRLAYWEGVTGLYTNQWRIRKMKTRWGSMSSKPRRLWVNLSLAKKPPQCLDYLLVHELCHLLVPHHGPIFWEQVTRFYPNWKEVRKLLNKSF